MGISFWPVRKSLYKILVLWLTRNIDRSLWGFPQALREISVLLASLKHRQLVLSHGVHVYHPTFVHSCLVLKAHDYTHRTRTIVVVLMIITPACISEAFLASQVITVRTPPHLVFVLAEAPPMSVQGLQHTGG